MKPKAPAKSSTLHDVAKAAGVSLITASRALSKPALVSEKTREKVRLAVQATGYIPNQLAGSLKSNRSFMVAGVIPSISVSQFLPTMQALTEQLAAAGYQFMFGQTGYDDTREDALIQTMISRRPDALVVTGLVQSAAARAQLQRVGIPVVETWDLSDRPLDMLVGFSHLKVGSAVAGYFLSKGWTRVGSASGDDARALRRQDGFIAAMGRAVPCAVVPAPSSMERGRAALRDLLQQDPGLRAVFCSSDTMAQGVLVEAQVRGLRVPEDLAICGFGDAAFSAHTHPSITTVYIDGAGIGRTAADLIVRRCNGEPIDPPVVDVGFRIIERESTRTDPP